MEAPVLSDRSVTPVVRLSAAPDVSDDTIVLPDCAAAESMLENPQPARPDTIKPAASVIEAALVYLV